MRPRLAWVDAAALVAPALVFVPLSLVRFVDGDEGVYAYASRLALHGNVPYRDFFYEQTPLLPYVYGAWIGITGESWYALRVLSALLACAVGALLYLHAARRYGRRAALLGLVLYASSALVFGFFVVVKTFALATLLLLGAFVLLDGRARSARAVFAAGVLAALAVDVRLVFLAAVPALAVATRDRIAPFAGGFLAGLLPSIVVFALAPRQFVFDNLGYHLAKDSGGLGHELAQKARTIENLVGIGKADHLAGLQVALLLVAAVSAAVLLRRLSLALWIALLLALGCLAPSPTYSQYFSVVVPFAVLGVLEAWPGRVPVVLVAAAAAYALAGALDVGRQRAWDPVQKPSIASVQAVAREVQRLSRPNERVLSSWPGYLFGTRARAEPDYTNHFAPAAASKLSPAEARRDLVASEAELEARIRAGGPRIVVYRNWLTIEPFARWDEALRTGGYRRVATVESAGIYLRAG
ncbi:MAG: hypothetical protein QOK32_1505 [Gaiellaceae bacterium]|nr:hypothetical protein [Gaiellaceae bacterium]